MDVAEARYLLDAAKIEVRVEERLPNETGTQLRTGHGAIVNVFDTGKFNVQGKNKAAVEAALGKPGRVAEGRC